MANSVTLIVSRVLRRQTLGIPAREFLDLSEVGEPTLSVCVTPLHGLVS